jgi:hypothetical protein
MDVTAGTIMIVIELVTMDVAAGTIMIVIVLVNMIVTKGTLDHYQPWGALAGRYDRAER